MASVVTVHVDGLRELGDRFATLDDKMQKSVARSMTNAGAQVIKKQAIYLAPESKANHRYYARKGAPAQEVDPGNLKKNVIVKHLPPGRTPLTSEHIVTVRTAKSATQGDPFAEGYFEEFGTVKESPAPWLRVAFDQEKGFALQAMKDKLDASLTKKGA